MAPQRIRRHAGDAKEQVHLPRPTQSADSRADSTSARHATHPTGNTSGAQPSEIANMPAGYTYSDTALPSAEIFDDDEDTERDPDFDPDMLTDDG